MSTRELVDALVAGDSIAIENSFNAVMSDRVSQALDNYRVSVAQKFFGAEAAPSEDSSNDNTEQA